MLPVLQFAALGDETRCRVLELLHERARPVHELAAEFSISRPAISRHLRVLKQARLIREEKRGRENVYTLEPLAFARLERWLDGFRPAAAPAPGQKATGSPQPPMPRARPVPRAADSTLDLFGFTA